MIIRRFLVGMVGLLMLVGSVTPSIADEPPRSEFEESEGATWTSHDNEVAFLKEVDAASPRVRMEVIGQTKGGKPLHLVRIGFPKPVSRAQALRQPTTLFVCSQHGNEPAGREACLIRLRDLAFTDDPALVAQLRTQTILFIPSANPDGREGNTRGNSDDVDVNRDHLNLETEEGQAMAAVVRDWQPEAVIDLHEYGPSIPVLYDDEVLVLWPRNLNVDGTVHDQAQQLALDYITADAEEAGYSTDEYGQYEVADQDIHQSAGDGDEGIARNAMGLRHTLGILVETRVDADLRNGPDELNEPSVRLRRVAAHTVAIDSVLRFMRERGPKVAKITQDARAGAVQEGRERNEPVFFGGADNQEPTEEEVVDPPPCGYALGKDDVKKLKPTLRLLGIRARGTYVSMAQVAEPVIPLLLDERGARHAAAGTPVEKCEF
ncbi:MAG: M14 family metallopeptidase [Actinomycetota bacterium]